MTLLILHQKYLYVYLMIIIFDIIEKSAAKSSSICNFTIDENQSPPRLAGKLLSTPGLNDFFELSEQNAYFTVDANNGWIQLKSSIDREYLCKQLQTCDCTSSAVVDQGQEQCYINLKILRLKKEPLISPPELININICVRDLNDVAPKMDARISLSVSEKEPIGTKIPLKPAEDPDSPANSIKSYSLRCENDKTPTFKITYNITEQTLALLVLKKLDRETKDKYECNIEASDGQYIARSELFISIDDENDHAPVWSPMMGKFEVTIPENVSPYSTIFRLIATDEDLKYGTVNYKISEQAPELIHKHFSVSAITGEVQSKAHLDYEDKNGQLFKIPIVAIDNGEPKQLSVTATLTVSVSDVNDNSPVIRVRSKILRIKENSPPTYQDHIMVSDADSGVNGMVDCRLDEGQRFFHLDKITDLGTVYGLYSSVEFDREKTSIIKIIITCVDRGKPAQTQRLGISVHILDENDSAPKFDQETYIIDVSEGTGIGSSLVRVKARDADLDSVLHYSMEPATAYQFVNIDAKTGEIYSSTSFDRETKSNYSFQITVNDGFQNHSDSANITLRITDINDNDPRFQQIYSFSVMENSPINTLVGQVIADDPDDGFNGSIIYRLADYSKSHLFSIKSDGKVFLNRILDRETKENYELLIVASDQGYPHARSTSTTVVINIKDDNDTPPRFNKTSYIRNIPCNQHYLATDITAHDADLSPNNVIKYRLLRVLPNVTVPHFTVNPDTGDILMKDSPENCKDTSSSHRLYIQAYDPTKRKFHQNISVTVNLLRRFDGTSSYDTRNGNSNGKYWKNYKDGHGSDSNSSGLVTDTNLFIVVILVCVSVLLAVLMLALIIYLKRKQDRDSHYEKGNSSPDVEESPGSMSTYQKRPEHLHYLGTLCHANEEDLCLKETVEGTMERTKTSPGDAKGKLRAAHSADNLYMNDTINKLTSRGGTIDRKASNQQWNYEYKGPLKTDENYHAYQTMLVTDSDASLACVDPHCDMSRMRTHEHRDTYMDIQKETLHKYTDFPPGSPSGINLYTTPTVSFDLNSLKTNSNLSDSTKVTANLKTSGSGIKTMRTINPKRPDKGPYFSISFV